MTRVSGKERGGSERGLTTAVALTKCTDSEDTVLCRGTRERERGLIVAVAHTNELYDDATGRVTGKGLEVGRGWNTSTLPSG